MNIARQMYPEPSNLVRLPRRPVMARDRVEHEYEEDLRIGGGCPDDNLDPDDIASTRLATLVQQMMDGNASQALQGKYTPTQQARKFASMLVREIASPQRARNGKRPAPVAFKTVVDSTGGPVTFSTAGFSMPAGSTAIISVTLNENYAANRLIIQHPASDDGLVVLDLKVAGRSQWFDSGPMAADAFDRDTQCPIPISGDIGKPGTPYQLELANVNGPGTTNLVFTALLTGVYLIGDHY